MNKCINFAAGVVIVATSFSAMAHDAGDLIIRAGAVNVNPDEESSVLNVADLGGDVPGTGVSVGSNTQLMLTATYMVSSHFGVELLAATPFQHKVRAEGLDGLGIPSGSKLGSVTQLPPTLSALWYPMDASSKFQPYIGVGLNYFLVLKDKLSDKDGVKSALGASKLSVDNSVGLAARAGFDLELSEKLSLNAGVWYIDVDSDASLNSALGEVNVDVDIDPWVFGVGLGLKF